MYFTNYNKICVILKYVIKYLFVSLNNYVGERAILRYSLIFLVGLRNNNDI